MRRPALGAVLFAAALAFAFWWQERQHPPKSEDSSPQGDLRPPAPELRPGPAEGPNPGALGTPAPRVGGPSGSATVESTPQADRTSPDGASKETPGAAGAPIPVGQPLAELPGGAPNQAPKHLWKADGPGIRGAVQESLPELKECYEEWQKSTPGLRGKVAIGFRISAALDLDAGSAPEAKVEGVRIGESELDHVFMEGCVSSVFSELRFAPPEGGKLEVTYPIQFESTEPPPP